MKKQNMSTALPNCEEIINNDNEEIKNKEFFSHYLNKLRRENLWINAEKSHIQRLNDEIKTKNRHLIKEAWRASKKRLALLPDRVAAPRTRTNLFDENPTTFHDARTILGYHNVATLSTLLQYLRQHPNCVADLLVTLDIVAVDSIIDTLLTGVYGACVYNDDLTLTLTLMGDVAGKQLKLLKNNATATTTTTMDQLLRKSSSPFRKLYYVFNEFYQPTRVFLAMTLSAPVKDILTFQDFYLDLDPEQSQLRYDGKRKAILDKLAEFLRTILRSLRANARLFPRPLAWLICQVRRQCQQQFDSGDGDVVVELLISQLICPAILDPELYGLSTDCLVGIYDACARHNLIAVSRLVQLWAVTSMNDVAHAQCAASADIFDLLSTFERDLSFGQIVTLLLSEDLDEIVEAPPVGIVPELTRDVMIFTEEELNNLIAVLQKKPVKSALLTDQLAALSLLQSTATISSCSTQNGEYAAINNKLLFPLEVDGAGAILNEPIGLLSEDKVLDLFASSSSKSALKIDTCQQENVNNNLDRAEVEEEETANSVASSLELNEDDDDDDDVILNEVDNLSDMVSANVSGRGTPNISGRDTPSSQINGNNVGEEDLLIMEQIGNSANLPASLSVQHQQQQQQDGAIGGGVSSSTVTSQQQRHSDIDDKFCKFEIKRHLLITNNDDNNGGGGTDDTDNMTAVSVISDTWSTDVLASDDNDVTTTTTVNNSCQNNNVTIMNVGGAVAVVPPPPTELSETLSETQSESAWSTDVMTSDTERLTEDLSNVSCQPDEDDDDDDDDDEEGGVEEKSSHKNSSASSSSSNSNDACFDNNTNNNLTPSQPVINNMTTVAAVATTTVNNKTTLLTEQKNDSLTRNGGIFKHKTTLATVSTGAIPKSISFDTDGNRNDRKKHDATTSQHRIGGFFGRFRKNFTKKRAQTVNNSSDNIISHYDDSIVDSSEDILEKYRKSTSLTDINNVTSAMSMSLSLEEKIDRCPLTSTVVDKEEEENCNENVNSLTDVKRKVSLVLTGHVLTTTEIPQFLNKHTTTKTKFETLLRIAIAQKWRRQNGGGKENVRAAEALRCVQALSDSACQKLLTSLTADCRRRGGGGGHAYQDYLIAAKEELLMRDSYLTMLLAEIEQTHAHNALYEVTVRVRTFLTAHESMLTAFCRKFCHLQMADEKCDFLRTFLTQLEATMMQQQHNNNKKLLSTVIDNNNVNLTIIRLTLERAIIDRVYTNALYPNGDGDRDRDRVLHDHICQLSMSINSNNTKKDWLMIPVCYRRELPWQPAQHALKQMNVVRTPADKVQSVRRCACALLDLLGLSSGALSAAADDFTPVLVYVIIKVNPVALLSTIQYVNTFYSGQIGGEDEYWWTQFCACVEYIKTMDYY